MTMPLGSQTITLGVTGYFNAPSMGLKGLIIGNESPYTLSVTVGIGQTRTLYPETVDFFTTGHGFNGNVTYVPSGVLTNPTSYTASTITFDAVGINENIDTSVYPLALTRPAVNPTATGAPLFTTFFGGNSAGNNQSLNIFNPANSGVVATFHSAKAFTNSPGIPTANLIYLSGADLNFSGSAGAKSQQGSTTPPISVMHVTTDDSNSSFGGTALEVGRLPGSVTEGTIDLKTFPDNATLYPGGNMRLSLADTTNGHVFALTLKWSENVFTPPIAVQGATAVASVLDSENGLVGANFIKSNLAGGLTPIQLFTDGTGFYAVDQGGTLHRVFTFNSSGNPLQQGQAGDIMEFLGQLTVDQILNVTGASNLTGLLTLAGALAMNTAGTSFSGATNGRATLYQFMVGTLKLVLVTLTAWAKTTAGDSVVVLPTPFTNWTMGIAFGSGPVHLNNSVGANLSVNTLASFPAAAGSAGTVVAGTAGFNSNNVFEVQQLAIAQVALYGSQASQQSGIIFLIGV